MVCTPKQTAGISITPRSVLDATPFVGSEVEPLEVWVAAGATDGLCDVMLGGHIFEREYKSSDRLHFFGGTTSLSIQSGLFIQFRGPTICQIMEDGLTEAKLMTY